MSDFHFSKNRIESLTVVFLCALFLFFATSTALLGASIYKKGSLSAENTSRNRIAFAYLSQQATHCRQANGSISVDNVGGIDALALSQSDGDTAYVTYLYCYDGQLREMFVERGVELEPDAGIPILPLDSLAVKPVQNSLLQLTLSGENLAGSLLVFCPGLEVLS